MSSEVEMTLDDAVAEVLATLTGLDLRLVAELDKYQAITRFLNRALRAVALEQEWSHYSAVRQVGTAVAGQRHLTLPSGVRPRILNDDAARLLDPTSKSVITLAYFLPRDALDKYSSRQGLWVSSVRRELLFSRAFTRGEHGAEIHLPVMREPKMFKLPPTSLDPDTPTAEVPATVREQLVDFDYPDLVIAKAAYFYAQTDSVTQPRVQTLEANYKELMYALVERDTRNTDAPYQNEWNLGIQSSLNGGPGRSPGVGIADERGFSG